MDESLQPLRDGLTEQGINLQMNRVKDDSKVGIGAKSNNLYANGLDKGLSATQFSDNSIPIEKLMAGFRTVTQPALNLDYGNEVIACDTTANSIQINLPNAHNFLGRHFLIAHSVLGGSNKMNVWTDQTDLFQGVAGAGKTKAQFSLVNDFIYLVAIASDKWLIIAQQNGSYS